MTFDKEAAIPAPTPADSETKSDRRKGDKTMIRKSPRLRAALVSCHLAAILILSGCQEDLVVVQGMTAGDRACYLEVEDGAGTSREEMASFELCERTDLVGKRVRLLFEKAQVQAQSCQGNPDCTDSETVDLVHGVELVP